MFIFLSLLVSAFLVVLNGIFVAFEFAIVKVRPHRLQEMADAGNRTAALALSQTRHLDAYLAVCQFGITIASLALTVAFEPAIEKLITPYLIPLMGDEAAHSLSIGIALFLATSAHVIFGELVPKSVAILMPVEVTMALAVWLKRFFVLSLPFNKVYNGIANKIVRFLTRRDPRGTHAHEEHEQIDVELLLARALERGEIGVEQKALMENVLDFPERTAREVMTPAESVITLDLSRPWEENLAVMKEQLFTRYPVIDGDANDVVGYVMLHDVFRHVVDGRTDLRRLVRPLEKRPETMTLDQLRHVMPRKPLVAIYDEHNRFVGITTDEDVSEEILGEIVDENDEETIPPVRRTGDGGYLINGAAAVDRVIEELGLRVDPDELEGVDTFGGLVLKRLARQPKNRDEVELSGFRFTVEEADGFRITRLGAREVVSETHGPAVPRVGQVKDEN